MSQVFLLHVLAFYDVNRVNLYVLLGGALVRGASRCHSTVEWSLQEL